MVCRLNEGGQTQARSGSAITGSSDSGVKRPVKAECLGGGWGREQILTET